MASKACTLHVASSVQRPAPSALALASLQRAPGVASSEEGRQWAAGKESLAA